MLRRLLFLNGIAVIFAVTHHTIHWVLTSMFYWADRYLDVTIPYYASIGGGLYNYLVVIDHITSTAIPIFLLVSGLFMAIAGGSQKKSPGWALLINRITALLWPYLIWSAVGFLYNILDGERYTFINIVQLLLNGGMLGPYYYVPLLIQLYILSPFFFRLAKDRPVLVLLITLITKGLATLSHYLALLDLGTPLLINQLSIYRSWHLLNYAMWFVVGILIGQHLAQIKNALRRYQAWFLAGLLFALVLAFIETTFLRDATGRPWTSSQILLSNQLLALMFILSFFSFEPAIPKRLAGIIENIGTKSYGIYLIHIPVVIVAARIYQKIVPGLLAYPFLFQATLIVIGLAVPLLMMEITNRSAARRFYKYIFG